MRAPSNCHPDKPIHGKGLCRKCYNRDWMREHQRANPETNRAKVSAWQKANRKKVNAIHDRWVTNNKDKELERLCNIKRQNKAVLLKKQREYRAANKDKVNANARRYYAENKEARKAHAINYQGRKRGQSDGSVTAEVILNLRAEKNCFYCNCFVLPSQREVEHKIPLSGGGLHSIDNVVMACRSCNAQKGDKTLEEFAGYDGTNYWTI